MVARDPLRNIVIDQHPKVEKDDDGNVSSKNDPQVNSTKNLTVNRAKETPAVSGRSSGDIYADEQSKSKKKG